MKENKKIRRISLAEWLAEGESQFGKDKRKWRFRCPNCGETQTAQDFIDAGIAEPETKAFCSCIGHWRGMRGCNYTVLGLFQMHQTEVFDAGRVAFVFEWASK